MYIATPKDRFSVLFSTLVTASSITAPAATSTEPTGDGVITAPVNSAAIAFYGTNAEDETFTARITGWRRAGELWIPVPLLALSGILGAMTGASGQAVTDSHLFADTLSISTAFTSVYEIISPTSDQVAIAKVDLFGCEKLQVQVAKGTCDSVGALVAGF